MFNINAWPEPSSSWKTFGLYTPLVKFFDDGLTGSSFKSDEITNANGALYPVSESINNSTGIWAPATLINTIPTQMKVWGYFQQDDWSFTTTQTKTKTAESFGWKYKNFRKVKLWGLIQRPTAYIATSVGWTINCRKSIELNATTLVHLFDNGGTLYVVAATIGVEGALTFWTPVAVFSSMNEESVDIALIGTDKFAVAYRGATNYCFASVYTVSATTITAGAPVSMSAALSATYISICALATDKFAISYRDGIDSKFYLKVGTVAWTAIIPWAVALTNNTTTYSHGTLIQNGADKAVLVVQSGTVENTIIPFTVATTTITIGTAWISANVTSSGIVRGTSAWVNRNFDLVRLATDKILLAVWGPNLLYSTIFTISSNVVTIWNYSKHTPQNPVSSTVSSLDYSTNCKLIEIMAGTEYTFYGSYAGTTITISWNSTIINDFTDSVDLPYTNGATKANFLYNGVPSRYWVTQAVTSTGQDIFKHPTTGYIYFFMRMTIGALGGYIGATITKNISISLYNDIALISTTTVTRAFLFDLFNTPSVITTGKRAYLGIKNNDAATRYLYLYEALIEVE